MKQMDQQLKERLVGAAVLVVLGMLLIPTLLDGPPQTGPMRVGIELPTADEEGKKSHTIRLDVPSASPATGSIARPVESVPVARPQPADPASAGKKIAGTEVTPQKVPDPTPAVSAQSAVQESPPPAEAVPPITGGGWAVQVGSFSKQANADRLSGELAARGYDVFISRVVTEGNTWYRVRVGPVPNKAEAEALVTRLSASGQTGRVVSNEG